MSMTLQQSVAKLPEKYQPIYGHSELSDNSSRECDDRLATITQIHNALRKHLNRPLKVLDLGCAQGYFSLNLAAMGAIVEGIDFLVDNVEVCNALAKENPELNAIFSVGRVEDRLERLQFGEFDLILGLSVFHHVIHEKGIDLVKKLFNFAAERCGCLLLEIALKCEPLYWGISQPDNPKELLSNIAFTHLVTMHSTHLADIPRPMFVASNRYWILDGEAQSFYHWTTESHAFAKGTHEQTRRYFMSEDKFLKYIDFDNEHRGEFNRNEFLKEIEFLKNPLDGLHVPKLYSFNSTDSCAWVVMERVDGKLLLDVIGSSSLDVQKIILDVLDQLCVLENNGLYHNDLRTWNVMIDKNGSAALIDFGAIVNKPQDCVWPQNIFLSFFMFLYELVTKKVDLPLPFRTIAMSPGRFPAPYDVLVELMWKEPLELWSFNLIRKYLVQIQSVNQTYEPKQVNELWSSTIESAIQMLCEAVRQFDMKARLLDDVTIQFHERIITVEAQSQAATVKAQEAEAQSQVAVAKAQETDRRLLKFEVQTLVQREAELAQRLQAAEHRVIEAERALQHWQRQANQWQERVESLHASTSWSLTKPLRAAKRLLTGDFSVFHVAYSEVKLKVKQMFRPMLSKIIFSLQKNPVIYYKIKKIIIRLPWLFSRLRRVAINTRKQEIFNKQYDSRTTEDENSHSDIQFINNNDDEISPRAFVLYKKILNELDKVGG